MITYTINETAHQSLTDFLSVVKKGSITKARMVELAAVLLDDLSIKRQEAEPEASDSLPAGELVIEFREYDGTQRIIAWHQTDEEQPAGYRPDNSVPCPYDNLVRKHKALGEMLKDVKAKELETGPEIKTRADGVLSELQGITGIKAPIHVVLNRLRETQECADALMVLPTKAGTMQALRRVLALRAGLQDSAEYIKSMTGYLELLKVEIEDLKVDESLDVNTVECIESYEDQGNALLSIINELTKPLAPEDAQG